MFVAALRDPVPRVRRHAIHALTCEPSSVAAGRGSLHGTYQSGEWAFIHNHTVTGERVLDAAPALQPVARLVRSTHERFDGTSYPDGLSGEQIPLPSRIVFACDAFHAMISHRAYSRPISEADARAELRRCAGTQFDARVVGALVRGARRADNGKRCDYGTSGA